MSERTGSYSLRRRLLIWLLVPLCTIGVIAVADAYRTARQTANEVFDRVLSGSALAIAERVFVNDEGQLDVDIPYVAFDMLTSAAQDRVFYRLEGPSGEFITGYKQLGLPDPQLGDGRFAFVDSSFRGSPIRVAVYRGAASTGEESISYRIAVAETTNARSALTREILVRSAARQALLIGAAAIIVWIAVTRSLVPLSRLEAAIARRSPSDLRAIRHHVPAEVGGLVQTINGFMERLGTALTALKHFTANASHQIRTPLTIVRTQLALAGRADTMDEAKAALEACDEAVVDAERTLSQLLLLARIDEASSKALAEQTADLADLARSETANHVIAAAEAGFDLGFEGYEAVSCRGDPVLLRELIGNLIDNAVKHAEGGTRITVRVGSGDDWAVLQVDDDGCGIPAKRRPAALGRFVSGSNGSADDSGLGLSIAYEIVRLFAGSIDLLSGEDQRGLRVEIRLPLAAHPAGDGRVQAEV